MKTKEKILKSAVKLFAKQGVDKTSTAEITKDVGIAEGTLFVHFKTKQDLVDALYVQIKRDAIARLHEHIKPKASVEKNIREISTRMIDYFLANYQEFVFVESLDRTPSVSKEAVKKAQEEYAPLMMDIGKWHKAGKLKQLPLDLVGAVYWNTITAAVRYCHSKKMKKVNRKYLDLIWDAIK